MPSIVLCTEDVHLGEEKEVIQRVTTTQCDRHYHRGYLSIACKNRVRA